MFVKYVSISFFDSPIASKICAPRYDCTVEIPIFDATLMIPLLAALMKFFFAWSTDRSFGRMPSRCRSAIVSNATYGLIAPAPYPINRQK